MRNASGAPPHVIANNAREQRDTGGPIAAKSRLGEAGWSFFYWRREMRLAVPLILVENLGYEWI
jgi:hypothetical protein